MKLCLHTSHMPADIKASPCQKNHTADSKNRFDIINFFTRKRCFDKTENNKYNCRYNDCNQPNSLYGCQILGYNAEQICNQRKVIACKRSNSVSQKHKIAECTESPYETQGHDYSHTFPEQKCQGKRCADNHHITQICPWMIDQKLKPAGN